MNLPHSPKNTPPPVKIPQTLILLLILACFIRILIILFSMGSNDMMCWLDFIRNYNRIGICESYEAQPLLNHPPFSVAFFSFLDSLRSFFRFQNPEDVRIFFAITDFIVAFAIYLFWLQKKQPDKAVVGLGAYLLMPVSFLLSSFHGNTDSLVAMFLFFSVFASQKKAAFLSGLFLGISLNVKVIGVLFFPLLVFSQQNSKSSVFFSIGFFISVLPMFFFIDCQTIMIQHVFGYVPQFERWGIPYFIEMATGDQKSSIGYRHFSKYLITGVAFGMAFFKERYFLSGKNPEFCSLLGITLLLLAPGFGIQYLLWFFPLLFLVDLHLAKLYGIAASSLLLFDYWNFIGFKGMIYTFHTTYFYGYASVASVICWGLLSFIAYRLCQRIVSKA